jgi:hypothetical protein
VRRRALTFPLALLGAGSLVAWGIGVADAATGGTFVLGRANSESSTATLTNTRGTPLSLKAKTGYPPLAVNSSKLVARLNAAKVGGLPASRLQRRLTGSACPTGIGSVATSGAVTCADDQLIFTSDGSFTVPAHVTHITGEIWGAGGGGGYANYAEGGAGGGFAEVLITVSPGQTYDVVVGAGGDAAIKGPPLAGDPGGSSSIGSGGVVLADATGGAGGQPCGSLAAGGRGELFATAGIIGLSAANGANGYCYATNQYFVGTGGGASDYRHYSRGYAGEPGLVLISFSD